jgi:pilus assembly protein CpaB
MAAAIGLFAFDYLSAPRRAPTVPDRTVVVAATAIPARQGIDPSMLTTQTRPADQVQPGSFGSVDALQGDVALSDIPAGSTLTSANAGRTTQLRPLVTLREGMRAMSIPSDEIKSVSGLVQPGDRVDVYAITQRAGTGVPQAFGILRDVRVLAVGGSTFGVATGGQNAGIAHSITLEVTPQQAKTLALADLNSVLRLALRPPNEPARSVAADAFVLAAPAPPAAAPMAPAAAPAPQAPAAPVHHGDGVEYILGDKVQGP